MEKGSVVVGPEVVIPVELLTGSLVLVVLLMVSPVVDGSIVLVGSAASVLAEEVRWTYIVAE
jgi:hypothetical protein